MFGKIIELRVVIRCEKEMFAPVETKPANRLLDRCDELHVLGLGVRVVHAQVALAAEFACNPEVQADRLGMANVQIAVWLRREARGDAATVAPAALVFGHDGAQEILRFGWIDCVCALGCAAHGSPRSDSSHAQGMFISRPNKPLL